MSCFDLNLEKTFVADYPFKHLISTGRLSAMTDRWGNIALFTTEGGYMTLTPNRFKARSGLYHMIEINGEYSGEMNRNRLKLLVKQEYLMPPEKKSCMIGYFTFKNIGSLPIEVKIILNPKH